jgi:3-oxoadipate enol-lactonase
MSYARNGKVNLYYEAYGAGEPLVFVHGAGGNAACWWQQVPFFAARYRVIVMDQRNFARSPCTRSEIGLGHYVPDLLAILDAEQIERTLLVGQSLGGWTAMGLTLQSPDRVRGLVMSHTPGGISNAHIAAVRDRAISQLPALTEPFAHWALAPDFHRRNPNMANLYNQISAFNTEFKVEELVKAMWEPLDLTLFEGYKIPTLFITANGDQIFPPELIRLVAEQVPGAGIKILDDGGHSSYFEAPALYNAALAEFFEGIDP